VSKWRHFQFWGGNYDFQIWSHKTASCPSHNKVNTFDGKKQRRQLHRILTSPL